MAAVRFAPNHLELEKTNKAALFSSAPYFRELDKTYLVIVGDSIVHPLTNQ